MSPFIRKPHTGKQDFNLLIKTCHIQFFFFSILFGSDRRSRSANVSASVRSVQTCLEQSIFIILAQIFKQSVRNKSAVSEHSESTQRAISEHQNKSQYRRSLKYCVLFSKTFHNCMKTSVWIEKDLSGRDSDQRLVMTNKERGENN